MSPNETQHRHTASADSTRIYYETYTPKQLNAIDPVVLVHGIGGDLDAWQFVRELLLKAGIPCIALDLRGHGYSDHPRHRDRYTPERVGEDIRAVIETEGLARVTLVGHSGGAVLALFCAIHDPSMFSSLVLINGSYTSPRQFSSALVRGIARACIALAPLVSRPPTHGWHSLYPPGKVHKEFELRGLMRTMYHNSVRSYILSAGMYAFINLRARLSSLHLPTLIIAAENDGIYPSQISKDLHAGIPNSTLTIIPNANHVLPLNRPHEVAAAIIAFLSSVSKKKTPTTS